MLSTSVNRGGLRPGYQQIPINGQGAFTLGSDQIRDATIEFVGNLTGNATVILPLSGEDQGLAWSMLDSTGGTGVLSVASPTSATVALSPNVLTRLIWTGSMLASVDASGMVDVPSDGSDVTVALNNLVATGQNLTFPRGKTFIISGSLIASAVGQVINLNGATLKRAPQVTTTLTGTVTANVTNVLPVASSAAFAIGQTISITTGGALISPVMKTIGSGYTGTPSVVITGGGGTGATATANLTGTTITSLTLTNAGSGYITLPTITITGTGTGATATVQINSVDPNQALTITALGAGTITVNGTFDTTFNSGDTVYLCGSMVQLSGDQSQLIGPGTLDGNRANYTIGRWQTTHGVKMFGLHCYIQGIDVIQSPGEGIVVYKDYGKIHACRLDTLSGNGIHFTLSPSDLSQKGGHIVASSCEVTNCNLDPTVGHAFGGIIWSNNIRDATVTACMVDGTPYAGIGVLQAADSSHVTVSGCVVRNAGVKNGSSRQSSIVVGAVSTTDAAGRVTITGNRLYSSGPLLVAQVNGGATVFPSRVAITGNYIDSVGQDTDGIQIIAARHIAISDNILENTASQTTTGIRVTDSKNLAIHGNVLNGYQRGIQCQGTLCEQIAITGNTSLAANSNGINIGIGMLGGIVLTGNSIESDSTQLSTYTAIGLGDGNLCSGNSIFISSTNGGASVGIAVQGNNNTVIANQLRGGSGRPVTAIVVTAAKTGNVIAANSISSTAGTQLNLNGTTINDTTPGSGNYQTA